MLWFIRVWATVHEIPAIKIPKNADSAEIPQKIGKFLSNSEMVHTQASKVLHHLVLVGMTVESLVLKKMPQGSIKKKLLSRLADFGRYRGAGFEVFCLTGKICYVLKSYLPTVSNFLATLAKRVVQQMAKINSRFLAALMENRFHKLCFYFIKIAQLSWAFYFIKILTEVLIWIFFYFATKTGAISIS